MVYFYRLLLFPLSLLRLILVLFASLFFLGTVHVESKCVRSGKVFKDWSLKYWGISVLVILGLKVKVNQISKLNKCIIMPNHRSYLDVFLMAKFAPASFVAKEELRRWPIIGAAFDAGRGITVNRKEMKSMLATLNKIKKSLGEGRSVLLFPEGTTFEGPGTKVFKNGSFKIAADLQVPVIPCAIEFRDKANAWVGEDKFVPHFFRQMWKPITRVNVKFGEPIVATDYIELKALTKQSIDSMLTSIQF